MAKGRHTYLPALKYHWLTPLYDPLLRYALRETKFKKRLIEQAEIKTADRVLDLGCGTATLTALIKKSHPSTEVVGLDADSRVLAIAKAKACRLGLDLNLSLGMAFALPYADGTFDRVLSSLFFHHLTRQNKQRVSKEVFRVLRPGGELHVADWGPARNAFMRSLFLLVQLLDGFETTEDNVAGRLPEIFREAGFIDLKHTAHYATLFGTLMLYRCKK